MALTLDQSAVANTASGSTTGVSATMTTTLNDDIIVAIFWGRNTSGTTTMPTVASVSGGGLTWTRRQQQTNDFHIFATDDECVLEVWWAHQPTAGAITVTPTYTSAVNRNYTAIFGVNGCNVSSPWDGNASLPSVVLNTNTVTDTATHNVTFSTTHANDFLIGVLVDDTGNPAPTTAADTGWTKILEDSNNTGTGMGVLVEYKTVSATQSSVTQNVWSQENDRSYFVFVDALTSDSNNASSTIDQTLSGITQDFEGRASVPTTIAQTLSGITQDFEGHVTNPGATIDQTLHSITQDFEAIQQPIGTWASTETHDTFAASGSVTHAAPTFVNASAIAHQSIGTSLTITLPGSRVNGNLLLAMIGNGVTAGKAFTWPTDWTVLDSFADSQLGASWAYRFVDGTETDPTISWTGSTSADAQIWQYSGAVTVGALSKLGDQGFIATYSATAITTTAKNSLAVNLFYNNIGRTISATPSGWTIDTNTGPLSELSEAKGAIGSTTDAITADALSGSARWVSAEIELCGNLPIISATMGITEATDVWTGIGSLIGGSWHSTETADHLAVTGFVPAFGTFGPTEHGDLMDFEVFIPPHGSWASTEAHDIFASAGSLTAPLGMDSHATASIGGNLITHPTSLSVNLTTHYVNDVIVLGIYTGGFWASGAVASITDTAGLTWTRRLKRQIVMNHGNGIEDGYFEEWWAHMPNSGSTTITVNTDPTGAIVIDAWAIVGANYTTPFDTNTGSGWLRDNLGGTLSDLPELVGHFGNPNVHVWTDVPHTMQLAFAISTDQLPDTTVAPGYTFQSRLSVDEVNGDTLYLGSMSKISDTQQFGTQDTWFGPDGTHISNRSIMLENIVAATEPGTDDIIRWFFDGTGNRTIVQLGTGQNSTSMDFVTYRADTIALCAVLIQSNNQTRVLHITDTSNTSPGWERRSIVTDSSGLISLEIWWKKMLAPLDGQVTVTCDSNVSNGDTISAIVFGLNGPDTFNRGEIWDHNGTLPAVKRGTSLDGHQTVGPFSTSNDKVFVLAMGANVDSTLNDTSLDNRNTPPYLFLPAPAEVDSAGPPSYHIGMEYKFSAPVVNNATAEFDLSPAPRLWMMIADALPVGPVSPPHGHFDVTEPTDTLNNNGAFTAIGLDTEGWVGYVPATATMAPTEHDDFLSNNGNYEPLFDFHGWVGWIPAFAAFNVGEADDTLHQEGWVLGPTTILGRMAAGESQDRMALSNEFSHSDYNNVLSTGNRTSLITVTTNAVIEQGTPQELVDGALNSGGTTLIVANSQPNPMYFEFDFASPVIITEAKWYQQGNVNQPGLFKWQGWNGSQFVDISGTFVLTDFLGAGAIIGDLSHNVTGYSKYRILQTTAAGGDDLAWLREIEFKMIGTTGTMASVEPPDRWAGNALVIPTAHPHPARQRRLMIVT